MAIYITNNVNETEKIGYLLGQTVSKGVVAMFGDLGAGKTAFTRGFAKGMGINCDVSSPTFALVNEYRGEKNTVYHFDMYRITSPDDLETTGFYDYMDGESVLAIEWSENIESELPKSAIRIEIARLDENTREITIDGDERFADIGD